MMQQIFTYRATRVKPKYSHFNDTGNWLLLTATDNS